ncbi:hypothetical protein BDV93DRAFT_549543 [Ceratobasidium sp. AG-I]|nr:hypothetical protein BDV93DRAFT_549543 [Ceratobasidium sp. AG-I]
MPATQETNNQNRVPELNTMLNNMALQSRTRDPEYYYDDGNVVFLVGDVLFKLHKSILLSRMYVYSYAGTYMDGPVDPPPKITRSDIERRVKGTSDSDPFIISEVTIQQFRWFLLLLMGTPDDPSYESRFMPANGAANYTKDDFLCYLGISHMTRHFGMYKLGSWSDSRLSLVLESATGFVNTGWDKETLTQAGYFPSEEFSMTTEDDLRIFAWLALSTSIPSNPITSQPPLLSNLDTCVAIFKDPGLLKGTSLFGYVFTVILSLGHRSSTWTNQLTREDRTVLYAAQVHLTSLGGDSNLDLSWISQPSYQDWGYFCTSCTDLVDTVWDTTFAKCSSLNYNVPLEDISRLVLLPSCRQLFIDSTRSDPKLCVHQCAHNVWDYIDRKLLGTFYYMADKHNYFVENA